MSLLVWSVAVARALHRSRGALERRAAWECKASRQKVICLALGSTRTKAGVDGRGGFGTESTVMRGSLPKAGGCKEGAQAGW